MLRDFRIALCVKLREAFRVDSDPAEDKRVFGWLDNMVGTLYMALGGYFWKLDPEHVIQLVCYNLSLYLVVAVFVMMSVCSLMLKELDIKSLIVLFNFTFTILMFLAIHLDFVFHRFEITIFMKQIVILFEMNRRPQNQSSSEEVLLKFIHVYWAPLVWTTWSFFMMSMPVFDYVFNGRAYSLPFPLWFPFKTNNPLGYAAAYAFETYAVHFFCSFVIASIPLFFAASYVIFKAYDSLIDSIRSLHEDALAMYKLQLGERMNDLTDPATDEEYLDLYKDRVFQYCCERCLRQIDIWNLQISRVIYDLKRRTSLALTLAFTVAYMAIGAALCLSVIDIGDITLKVTFTAIGILDFFLIWIVCHASQSLIIKGEKVREELYFTNWYHWPEGMKRSLRLMLVRSLYPPHISAALLDIKADYITFTAVVNSTYSFVNLVYAFTH